MDMKCVQTGSLGVNTYYVRDEETNKGFIVDPGGFNQRLVNIINEDVCEIEYIILTHGHGDHIGGVSEFQTLFPKAKLVASVFEKEFLATASLNMSMDCCGKDIGLEADIWVKDGDVLKVGNMDLKMISTPGHTPGGMCILVDKILFSGDTLFQQSIGRTDFPGGSFSQLSNSIKNKLFTLPEDVVVYPGHMGSTTIGVEKRSNPFV